MFTYVYIIYCNHYIAHQGFAKGGNNPRSEFGFSKAKGKMPALTAPGLTKLFWF